MNKFIKSTITNDGDYSKSTHICIIVNSRCIYKRKAIIRYNWFSSNSNNMLRDVDFVKYKKVWCRILE